jgi:hypothetical protein
MVLIFNCTFWCQHIIFEKQFLIKRYGSKVSKKFLINSVFFKAMPYWAWLSPPIWCFILSLFAKSYNNKPNFEIPTSIPFQQLFFQPMGCPPIIYVIGVILGLKEAWRGYGGYKLKAKGLWLYCYMVYGLYGYMIISPIGVISYGFKSLNFRILGFVFCLFRV